MVAGTAPPPVLNDHANINIEIESNRARGTRNNSGNRSKAHSAALPHVFVCATDPADILQNSPTLTAPAR